MICINLIDKILNAKIKISTAIIESLVLVKEDSQEIRLMSIFMKVKRDVSGVIRDVSEEDIS